MKENIHSIPFFRAALIQAIQMWCQNLDVTNCKYKFVLVSMCRWPVFQNLFSCLKSRQNSLFTNMYHIFLQFFDTEVAWTVFFYCYFIFFLTMCTYVCVRLYEKSMHLMHKVHGKTGFWSYVKDFSHYMPQNYILCRVCCSYINKQFKIGNFSAYPEWYIQN